jgi:hypothetical protein
MIKSWQEFLLEAVYKRPSRGEVIEGSPDQIEEILQKWAPWYDPINIKMSLFRSVMVGTTSKPYYPYKVMDPKKFVRKPPSTENYYNIIIDNSENWKDYPKRSRSIMTHTLESKTKLYGNKVYRVIPLRENAKCAYVDNDYWMAFDELFKSWPFGKIESLNDFNKSLLNVFNLTKKDYSPGKLKQLLSSGNLNTSNLMYQGNMLKWKESIKGIESEYGSVYNWIDEKMKPGFTNVHLFKYNNNSQIYAGGAYDSFTDIHEGHEVWTDEKSLLIDNDILRKLYIKKKNPVD